MTMYERACEEVRIACKAEPGDDVNAYAQGCYKSALKAMKSLCEDGHSGMSIGFTRNILMRMIEGKPLTPIEDTPNVWRDDIVDEHDGIRSVQCKRMPSLFKYTNLKTGEVRYKDVERCYCVTRKDPDLAFTNARSEKIVDELFPITMPYYPSVYKKKIVMDEYLTDRKNGDYDTLGYLWLEDPDTCTRIAINRYFKEDPKERDFVEISEEEYTSRVQDHCLREALEFNNGNPLGIIDKEEARELLLGGFEHHD